MRLVVRSGWLRRGTATLSLDPAVGVPCPCNANEGKDFQSLSRIGAAGASGGKEPWGWGSAQPGLRSTGTLLGCPHTIGGNCVRTRECGDQCQTAPVGCRRRGGREQLRQTADSLIEPRRAPAPHMLQYPLERERRLG